MASRRIRNPGHPNGRAETCPYRLQLARRLLKRQYAQPNLRLHTLAPQVGLTAAHLSRLFVRHTGIGFSAHLHAARLEHAREKLMETPMSVKEIAALVGYKRVSDLDRHFRRAFGQTPTAYRLVMFGVPSSSSTLDPQAAPPRVDALCRRRPCTPLNASRARAMVP